MVEGLSFDGMVLSRSDLVDATPSLLSPAIPLSWQFVIHLPQLQATSAGMMDFRLQGPPPPNATVTHLPLFQHLLQSDLAAQWCATME